MKPRKVVVMMELITAENMGAIKEEMKRFWNFAGTKMQQIQVNVIRDKKK
jgi:hypothetical protein